MKRKNYSVSINGRLKRFLKENNLKLTPQRIAIYNELIGLDNHPSAVELYGKVKVEFPNISFDTVNRTLLTFYKIGLINIVEGSGYAKRFDPNIDSHHHFLCIKCGKIIDFTHQPFDNLDMPDKLAGANNITGYKVVIEGICEDCMKNRT